MKFQINPINFKRYFVDPILEINKDGKVTLFSVEDKKFYSITATKDRTVHLYSTYEPKGIESVIDKFSIDAIKLVKGLSCLRNVEDITLSVDDTNKKCQFKSDLLNFNIKLLDSALVYTPKFSVDTFNKFKIDHKIDVQEESLQLIKDALDFSASIPYFSLFVKDSNLYINFGDSTSTSNHTDDITVMVASNVSSNIPQKTYDINFLRYVNKNKKEFSINMSSNGVLFVEIDADECSNLKYITTPLITK